MTVTGELVKEVDKGELENWLVTGFLVAERIISIIDFAGTGNGSGSKSNPEENVAGNCRLLARLTILAAGKPDLTGHPTLVRATAAGGAVARLGSNC